MALSILLLFALVFIPIATYALGLPTVPYGGKVLTTTLPTVTCFTTGTAPVVLSSNLAGLGMAVGSATSNTGVGGKVAGLIGGLYKALPLNATNPAKRPRPGDWILGRHEIIPSFTTCTSTALGGFPVPVKKTTIYGVSR